MVKTLVKQAVTFHGCALTSATLIHFSSSRALCWLRSFVGQRQDAKTALANLLNWRMVARTDQQTPSLPFLSLCDHSEPRQWYGTRRTNSSWEVSSVKFEYLFIFTIIKNMLRPKKRNSLSLSWWAAQRWALQGIPGRWWVQTWRRRETGWWNRSDLQRVKLLNKTVHPRYETHLCWYSLYIS